MGIWEKYYPFIFGIGISIYIYFSGKYPNDILYFKDILSSTISMGSIAIGFLSAAITMMPAMSGNSFIKKMKDLGAYNKLLHFLFVAIVFLFGNALVSLMGLFFNLESQGEIIRIFFIIWGFVFTVSILSIVRVISGFLNFLSLTSKDT